jgi:mannose-6-phosphate isomerase-like protein (cupin superfamily)
LPGRPSDAIRHHWTIHHLDYDVLPLGGLGRIELRYVSCRIELLYVLSGKLELHAGEDRHQLSEGDSIYFDSSVSHGYRRIGAKRIMALVVTLPPRE